MSQIISNVLSDKYRVVLQFKESKQFVTTDYFADYDDAYKEMISLAAKYGVETLSVRMVDSFLHPYDEFKDAISIKDFTCN